MNSLIRSASVDDLPALLAIYNHAVLHTTAIWNETPVDLANRQSWLAQRQADGFPVLVAIVDGQVAGYASYGPWRAFEGFRQTVEHSVYVAEAFQGRGLGKALLRTLIEQAKVDQLHVLVAGIEAQNHASIALHQGLGFVISGQMPQVGRKFERWLDLTFMQLILE